MNNFNESWYVIYTRPKHEKKVRDQLEQTGIVTLLPMVKTLRQWHDRKKYLHTPLFPSYIFVYLKNRQDYFNGLKAEGVLYFIKTGNKIERVSDTVINNIKLAVDGSLELEIADCQFKPGQHLVIRKGTLTGLNGEVVRVNGKQKILIRVNLLQRNILLNLSMEECC